MTCKTTKLKDVITCVEGIKVLFPLFLVLGEPGECVAIPDKELFVQVIHAYALTHTHTHARLPFFFFFSVFLQ